MLYTPSTKLAISVISFLAPLCLLGQQVRIPGVGGVAAVSSAVAFVQDRGDGTHGACNNGGTPSSTLNCNWSVSPTAGNTLIAVVYTYNTYTSNFTNPGGTDTYNQVTLVAGSVGSGSVNHGCLESTDTHKVVCIWYAFNIGGGTASKNTTASVNASSYIIVHMYEVSGLLTTASFDVTNVSTDNNSVDTSQTGPTVSTSNIVAQTNEFTLNACAFENTTVTSTNGGSTVTFTMGMTDTSVSTNVIAGSEQYATINTIVSITAKMTLSLNAASGYTCSIVAFKHP